MEAQLRRLEAALGDNRHGRTVWVWALPPLLGVIVGLTLGFGSSLPVFFGEIPVGLSIWAGLFGFVVATFFSAITLAWFGDSENEE